MTHKKVKEINQYFKRNGNTLESITPIKTIEEYVKLVRLLTSHWNTRNAWFRGLSKESYELVPNIYRSETWKYNVNDEIQVENEFIWLARSFIGDNSLKLSRWEWYQIMQHHGLPTRLLDWSSSSNVALYFALRNLERVNNATVWIIDPYWLNNKTTDNEKVYYTDPAIQDKDDKSIVDNYVPSIKCLPELPIAILPAHVVPRIVAQHCCFTIHGMKRLALDKLITSKKEDFWAHQN